MSRRRCAWSELLAKVQISTDEVGGVVDFSMHNDLISIVRRRPSCHPFDICGTVRMRMRMRSAARVFSRERESCFSAPVAHRTARAPRTSTPPPAEHTSCRRARARHVGQSRLGVAHAARARAAREVHVLLLTSASRTPSPTRARSSPPLARRRVTTTARETEYYEAQASAGEQRR